MEAVTMKAYSHRAIDGLSSIHGGAVKLAGAELGTGAFGLQVLDFPAGFDGYPEHDHAADGQEEVYLVLRGSAEFAIDGDRLTVGEDELVRVSAGSRRTLTPGADGVRILAIGCAPGGVYERPAEFQAAAPS
jgi:mannose-6-phosphate isomerase-like protein (cupin superfamily)